MKIKIKIRKKWILLFTIILLLIPLTAYAQDTANYVDQFLRGLSTGLNTVLRFMQTVFWPILVVIGGLLSNDLLFSSGMEERLLSVWVEVRNFVNIAFVVLLIGIAIYNVLGIVTKEEYMLKKIIPKFIVALILVNFSFVGMKILIDTTNVITTAVFAMPASISDRLAYSAMFPPPDNQPLDTYISGFTSEQTKNMRRICRNIYGDKKEFPNMIKNLTPTQVDTLKCEIKENEYRFNSKGIDYFSRYNSRNAAMIMAMQMMNIIQVDEISQALDRPNVTLTELAFNLLFSVVLYVLYGAAYITLFVVLLVRLVVLWIFVALSPVFALMIVFPNMVSGAGGGDLKEKFTTYLLAPIYIGVPLTIGYLMLDAFQKFKPTTTLNDLSSFTSTYRLNASGISDLQQMIIAFAAVAVVWVGVFVTVGQKIRIAGWIGDRLRTFGRYAGKLVRFAPILPTGVPGEKTSLARTFQKMRQPFERVIREGGALTGPLPTLRNITTLKQFQEKIKPYRARIEERRMQQNIGEMLARIQRRRPGELRKFLTPRARRALGVPGTLPAGEVIRRFRKGAFRRPRLTSWLEAVGVRPAAAGAGAIRRPGEQPPARYRTDTTRTYDDAKVVGLIDVLNDEEKKKLVTLKGNFDRAENDKQRRQADTKLKESDEMKKLTNAYDRAGIMDIYKNSNEYKRTNNAEPLAKAVKAYYTKINERLKNPEQARKFTESILKKKLGTADYEKVMKLKEMADVFK